MIVSQITRITWIISNSTNIKGNIGMAQCPGKNLNKSRTDNPIHRNLEIDLKQWKTSHKVTKIFCLLNDYEIRTLGVDDKSYKKCCEKQNIQFIQYPITEMSIPQQDVQINHILKKLAVAICEGDKIVIHCRGGIGRTGIIACALLKLLDIQNKFDEAIRFVRKIRDKRCVQSKKQQEWVKKFFQNYSNGLI